MISLAAVHSEVESYLGPVGNMSLFATITRQPRTVVGTCREVLEDPGNIPADKNLRFGRFIALAGLPFADDTPGQPVGLEKDIVCLSESRK